MPRLRCPRCAAATDFEAGATPACPACGYPGADVRLQWRSVPDGWMPPNPGGDGSGRTVALVLGIVGGIAVLTVALAAVVFVLVTKLADNPAPATGTAVPFTVLSARVGNATECGDASGKCHVLALLIDARNATAPFGVGCCWSAIDGQGGDFDGIATGEPSAVEPGRTREVQVRFLVQDPRVRLQAIWYDRGSFDEAWQAVPLY